MTNHSVLFVDSEQLMLNLARKVLEPAGFGVMISFSREVLQHLNTIQPALIILDITDQDEANPDLITQLKSRSATPYIPLILTSADLFPVPSIFEADAFFVKPYQWDNLINVITLLITEAEWGLASNKGIMVTSQIQRK